MTTSKKKVDCCELNASAEDIINFLTEAAKDFTNGDRSIIQVTDVDGNPLQYARLFEETLSDGSIVYNAVFCR